ncbi:MAG: ATP-binding cassette domain-containing protein [Sphaerobacter sp.]|nr:ATP-binding cassette domain-containing protein [Sphaerobacter sp.]
MELIAAGLTKRYGDVPALRGVSLRAGPGVLAVLGPNGSGKTTLLRILATALRPDAGRACFAGRDYGADPRPLRRRIGYLPQEIDLPGHLTPRALLHYVARLKGVPPEPQADALLHRLGLGAVADRRLQTLSGGQARLAALAQALLGRPRLLILDEPLTGLDAAERGRVLRLIAGPPGERVVILSSHVPTDVEAGAAQVLILQRGTVRACGSVEAIRALAAGQVHEVTVPAGAVEATLGACQVSQMTLHGAQARVRVVGPLPPGLPATPVAPTLEDAYLWVQGGCQPPS